MVLHSAGYHVEAGRHLRDALIWLPATEEGNVMRVRTLQSLADVHPEEVLQWQETKGGDKMEAIQRGFRESLKIFEKALEWGSVCKDAVEMNVDTLLRKSFFCRGFGHCIFRNLSLLC